MAFRDVPNRLDFPAQERELLQFWKDNQAFQKMRQLHQGEPHWSFIDGPITANNPMGVHHGWGRTYKDLMQRFRAMQGTSCAIKMALTARACGSKWKWKKRRVSSPKKILRTMGWKDSCACAKRGCCATPPCRPNSPSAWVIGWIGMILTNCAGWQIICWKIRPECITVEGPEGRSRIQSSRLLAGWACPNWAAAISPSPMKITYMIWTFLKKCWEKGWVYRGVDVMPWCPRCATGISQHEIVTDGYAELTHQSVTLRSPIAGCSGTVNAEDPQTGLPEALLVWTTTPWTLTSNVAAAVGPELTYAKVRQGDEVFYLAKGTLHMLKGQYELLAKLKGANWTAGLMPGRLMTCLPHRRWAATPSSRN